MLATVVVVAVVAFGDGVVFMVLFLGWCGLVSISMTIAKCV